MIKVRKTGVLLDRSFLRAGFTLIEILIAMGIMSGIVFVISTFGLDIFNFQIFLGDAFIIQQEMSLTLTSMGIEVRAMGPSANGSYPIESASPQSVVFYSDVDGDNVFERVRYYASGGKFMRGVTEPSGNPAIYNPADEKSKELVNNVILPPIASQPLFSYYDEGYTGNQEALPSPVDINKIRLIKATITADRTSQDMRGRSDYSAVMLIRNLKGAK